MTLNEEKIEKSKKALKARKTKLLNKVPTTQEEFEIIQDELNRVEFELANKGE